MLPEARLYHYKARVYDPSIGRFLQTDPIGYEDDLNLYAYVRNDPLNRADATGTCGTRLKEETSANCKSFRLADAKNKQPEKRQSSATLRRKWEQFHGKTWPKDPKTNHNQDVAHKQAVADQGAPNDVRNYDPKTRDQHMKEHMENGDFKRWGARGQLGKTVVRGLGAASALGVLPGVLDLKEALKEHPDLPFSMQFGILGGSIDPKALYRIGEGHYLHVPAWVPSGT